MTRKRAVAYAGLIAVEVAYILHANLPTLWPPPCRRISLDACILIQPLFSWLWTALAALLVVSAIAILLYKPAGIAVAFVGQTLLLPPFLRDMVYGVGSFLFTGSGYSGIDPSYRDLAFTFLGLVVVVGPALTLLLLMSMRTTTGPSRPSRMAATLLAAQTAILVVVALVVFRATLHDCSYFGADPPTIDGVPDCTDLAHMDVGNVVGSVIPSVAVLLLVSVGVWRGRAWAISGAVVWQLLLALTLAALGVAMWTDQSQNAWYDHFPTWTSPRNLAYALIIIVPVPALAALLGAQTNSYPWPRTVSGND